MNFLAFKRCITDSDNIGESQDSIGEESSQGLHTPQLMSEPSTPVTPLSSSSSKPTHLTRYACS